MCGSRPCQPAPVSTCKKTLRRQGGGEVSRAEARCAGVLRAGAPERQPPPGEPLCVPALHARVSALPDRSTPKSHGPYGAEWCLLHPSSVPRAGQGVWGVRRGRLVRAPGLCVCTTCARTACLCAPPSTSPAYPALQSGSHPPTVARISRPTSCPGSRPDSHPARLPMQEAGCPRAHASEWVWWRAALNLWRAG